MVKVWKIAPGQHAEAWDGCLEHGCIVIGWKKLGDYERFKSQSAIRKALLKAYPDWRDGTGPRAARSVWRFANDVQPIDIVVANDGRGTVVGIGVVESDYLAPTSSKNPSRNKSYPSARVVDWLITKPVRLRKYFFVQDTVWPLEPEQCEEIKRTYLKKHPEFKASFDRLFDGVSSHDEVGDSVTKNQLAATEQQLEEEDAFDPAAIKDARERTLSSIVRRRGQPAFRRRLLAGYNGRCCVSGCHIEAILEAAHIVPYRGAETNHPANGLLLKADLHTLFDLRLIAVDPKTMAVLVSPKLEGSEYYKYRGKPITVPDDPACQPSRRALARHRKKSRL